MDLTRRSYAVHSSFPPRSTSSSSSSSSFFSFLFFPPLISCSPSSFRLVTFLYLFIYSFLFIYLFSFFFFFFFIIIIKSIVKFVHVGPDVASRGRASRERFAFEKLFFSLSGLPSILPKNHFKRGGLVRKISNDRDLRDPYLLSSSSFFFFFFFFILFLFFSPLFFSLLFPFPFTRDSGGKGVRDTSESPRFVPPRSFGADVLPLSSPPAFVVIGQR